MSLKFIPPKQVARYALYIEYPSCPAGFKTFNQLGHAKLSFNEQVMGYRHQKTRYPSKILEMVDGEWYVLFDIPEGVERENLPWMKVSHRIYRYGYWQKVSEHSHHESVKKVESSPMSREEYADWRVRVELERRGLQ